MLNNYTGITSISNGSIVLSDPAVLGADTSTVLISGSATRGFGGGSLVLAGTDTSGVNFTRAINATGLGPITDRGAALVSVGLNQLSGQVSMAQGLVNTRFISSAGMLSFTGGLDVAGTAGTTVSQFGGLNTAGAGAYAITGALTGVGTLEKTGSGTLLLKPSDTSGFTGTLRVSSSATGVTSSVRITTPNVLGTRTATGTGGVLDINGGTLEVRMDTPSVLAGGAPANIYHRANTSTIFVDHAPGSNVINQVVTFGQFAFEENLTMNFSGRNGYGITLGAAPVQGGTAASTITNNMNGTLTFTGAFWSNADTSSRTMTINGAGNTLISGNFTASSTTTNVDHSLTKAGTGTLTISSTGGTLDGQVNINAGTLAIADFRSVNNSATNNSGAVPFAINIGSSGTAGTLNIGVTGVTPTGAGLTSQRAINLSGTTGGATINASQPGLNPVIIATMGTTGAGAKTLTLGGSNTADNAINGVIADNGAVTIVKTDLGTWVLGGNNTYTGTTTISGGTLKLKASAAASNIIASTGAFTFNSNATTQTAGGTLELVGLAGSNVVESLGALTPTQGMNTVKVTPGSGGTASLTFSSLGTVAGTAAVNFITPNPATNIITLTGQATTTAATLPGSGRLYINGSNFARINAGQVVTPVYGTDAGFVNAGAALTASSHNRLASSIASQAAVTVSSLKIDGSQSLNMAGTLTVSLGGVLQTDGSGVISGAGITTSSNAAFSARVNLPTDSLTISAPISGTTGGLTKTGAGVLVLSGANAQTGATTINEGTLRLSGGLATLSGASQDLTIRQGAVFDLNGVSTGATIKNLIGSGTITNGVAPNAPAAATLTVGNGTPAASTFSGVIQDGTGGPLSIVKRGTVAFTFSGLNTYTGSTTIESTGSITTPTLADIGLPSGIGAGSGTSNATNAASLVFQGPGTSPTPALIYTGGASVSTNRLFTLDMATAGSTAVITNNSTSGSALIFSNTSPIVFGPNATTSQTLTLSGSSSADSAFFPQVTDNGALPTNLIKAGAGQWILANSANTYTGTTAIAQGVLVAQDGQGLPSASGLLLGATTTSGVLQTSGNFTRNVAAAAGAGTVTWNGTTGGGGFAAFDTKLVVALGGTGSPTPLQWGVGGFVGTGGVQTLFLSSTTALDEVEWRNAIDLNGGTRTIQVDDNGNTASDFATITGVISNSSGTGNLTKAGTGILQLFGENSYAGNTNVTAGTLVVSSLGLSTGPVTNTSVGTSTGAETQAQAVTLGNGTTTGGILMYVGGGETSDRMIRLNTTTAANQIHASGTGPLILTNVLNDLATGAKVLNLRGSNAEGNMITSQLTDNGGALGITVDGSAVWILANGTNSYTGVTTVSAGALGIGADTALGTGSITLSNSSVFAYGADRVVANNLTHNNNTTQAFIGDYSLSFTGTYANASAGNSNTITNNILAGKSLTLNNVTNNSITAARTLTFNGAGATVINGDFTTSTAFNMNLTYSGTGSLTLGGTNTTGNVFNGGTITLSSGSLILGANEVLPDIVSNSANTGNVVISPAAGITATLDLNGRTDTINGLTGTSAGTLIMDNSSASAATLTVGANDQAANWNGSITRSGGGGITIGKTGVGAATFAGPADITAINVQSGLLKFTGGITSPSQVTSIIVAGEGLLQLFDGVGTPLSNLTTLNLGAGSGTATLELDAGLTTDTLTATTAAVVANTIKFNIRDVGLSPGGTYSLLVAPSGLAAGSYTLGPIGGYTGSTLNVTDTLVQLTLGTAVSGAMYWNGAGSSLEWNLVDGLGNGLNWATDKAGTVTPAPTIPGAGTSVVFQADNAVAAGVGLPLATTLEQSVRINNLVVETATAPLTALSIGPGAIPTNRLTIQPISSVDGIDIKTGAAQGVLISSQLAAGSAQTWNVGDFNSVALTGGVTTTGSPTVTVGSTASLVPGMQIVGPGIPTGAVITQINGATSFTMSANATGQNAALQNYTATSALTASGGLFGSGNITKTGSGRVVLSGAGNTYTGTAVNVIGGILELQNVTALGGVAATPGTGATVTVNGGAMFRYNSATAGTVANPIVLNGGTLASGGYTSNATSLALTAINHTFSGPVTLAADSAVSMSDLGAGATPGHTVTLSGVLSGAAKLTVDSVGTVSSGNQLTGTLVLSTANPSWTGGMTLKRGTVDLRMVDSLGTGAVNVELGRILFKGATNTTWNQFASGFTLDAASGNAVVELQPDNQGTSGLFTTDITGTMTLGGGGAAPFLRLYQADAFSNMTISGPVVLKANATIHNSGAAANQQVNVISGVISENGGSFGLSINGDTAWGSTNYQVLRLDAANTFTGPLSLAAGTVEFTTVTNAGGAASNLGQGSSINLGGTLRFVGSLAQSTDRPITLTAGSTLNASGSGGATITYSGAITGGGSGLTLDGNGEGFLDSILTQTGTAADITKAGTGTWSLNATNVIADDILVNLGTLNVNASQQTTDDFVVTGGASPTIVNLNVANAHQGDDFFIRSGATVFLGVNGALSNNATNGMDALLIGDSGTSGATLDLKGRTGNTVNAATIGTNDTISGFIIDSVGGGDISSTGWTVRFGEASATLAGATLAKNGAGTFTLSGNNTYTGATTVTEGTLLLDYTTRNGSKIASAAGVTIGGAATDTTATLNFNGNASAPSTQAFTTLTISQGSNNFVATSNGGQAMNVNFTTITRNAGGTIDFSLPAVGSITSTQAFTNGALGYATVSNGAAFLSKDGSNNLLALVPTVQDDVTTWLAANNVGDSASGFSGLISGCIAVNSITFNTAGSTVNSAGVLGIGSGGILITSTATGAQMTGGVLRSGLNDVIVHQYATGDFVLNPVITGSTAITKTGAGGLILSGANTFTGAVNITEGFVRAAGGQGIGDAAPVALKDIAGVGLQLLASETIGNLSGGGGAGGNVLLGSNALTTNVSANSTFSGLLVGNGSLVKQGTANLNLDTSSSTGFNGSVVINQGLLQLSGNGIVNLPAVTAITSNVGGSLLIDFNSGTTGSSRINDAATINLSSVGNGSFFGVHIRSNQDAGHSETIGAINLVGGGSTIGVSQAGGTGRTLTLTTASLNRLNNATVFLDGRNFAVTSGDNRGRLFVTSAPATVGGTGAPGSTNTNVPVIRYAVTLQNPNAIAIADIPNTFANYNATTGVTPLNIATEYKLDAAGYTASIDANDNLRFTTIAGGLAAKTFNAVVFDSSAAPLTISGAGGGGNVLTVNSGAMLFTSTASANGTTLDGFDAITPGAGASNEFIITVANNTSTINSVLTDGAAATTLTKSGTGTLVLGGVNTYTGPTYFNQGILSVSSLGNLGVGGSLNFFGGTLQFGGVFDPSARTVNINSIGGGATFDTNGFNVSLANAIGGGGLGSFTKTGAGVLTFNVIPTYAGGTTVLNGTLAAAAANVLPAGNLTVNGATADLNIATFDQTVGTLTLANGAVNGMATIVAGDYQFQAGTVASTVVLAGAAGLTKTNTGTVVVGGANTFSGAIAVQGGVLSFDSIANADGTASALGAPATALTGTIQMGLGTTATGLTYTGSGHSTNRVIALVGTTGATTVSADGTGALVLTGGVTSMEYGSKSLVLSGTSDPVTVVNRLTSPIVECYGVVTLQKLGSNTWRLDTVSTYSGATQVDNGTLRLGVANALPATTAMRLGSTTTAGVFDMNGFDQTVGSLVVQTNSNTVTNQLQITPGNTLTINGAVTVGVNTSATAVTQLTASGGGSLIVNSGGASFQVGGATGATNSNAVTADFSGLNTFTANLGTGTFRLGDANTGTTADPSSLKLAVNNTITAASIRIGDGSGPSSTHTLTLGSGGNVFNADTINVGSSGATIRSSGAVVFDGADTTGTLQVRASDGTSGATVNMANTTGSTAGNIDSTINLAGHTTDMLASTLTMASRTANTGAVTATLTFDQGTLNVTTLNMASRTGAGTGDATATLNLGDSAAPGSPTTNIGTVNMAVNTAGGGTVTSNMVITGGTVNIGTGTGTAINMANAAASRTATSNINLTGGTLSVTGNIVRTGGLGTETATITVNGGSLNLNGNSIGTAGAPITLLAQSGTNTITGLAELNGGGLFTKSTTGTLSLGDGNTYTGGTQVADGTLLATNTTGSATGSGPVTVDATGTLGGNGSIIAGSGSSITVNGTLDAGLPAASSGSALALTVGGAGNLALNGTTLFQLFTNTNTGTLNGNTAADQVVVNAPSWSNVVLGGSSILNITTGLTSTTFVAGDSWKIFDWTGVATGSAPVQGTNGFNSITAPTLDVGLDWDYSALFSAGTISVIVVPEPSRALLLMLGLLGICVRRRRK
ncbi:MAG: autotransporter-associated beta strand repeat-containing protein [Verrucomicrobiaceae bacterium]